MKVKSGDKLWNPDTGPCTPVPSVPVAAYWRISSEPAGWFINAIRRLFGKSIIRQDVIQYVFKEPMEIKSGETVRFGIPLQK